MTTLTQLLTEINTEAAAADALACAERFFVEKPSYVDADWPTVARIYLERFGLANNVDLSHVEIPAAPEIDNWLANLDESQMEDIADYLSAVDSGIPQF